MCDVGRAARRNSMLTPGGLDRPSFGTKCLQYAPGLHPCGPPMRRVSLTLSSCTTARRAFLIAVVPAALLTGVGARLGAQDTTSAPKPAPSSPTPATPTGPVTTPSSIPAAPETAPSAQRIPIRKEPVTAPAASPTSTPPAAALPSSAPATAMLLPEESK